MERSIDVSEEQEPVEVAKADLTAAWRVLENLAVSLDQIGGILPGASGTAHHESATRALSDALRDYFTPELVKSIGEARARLGAYLSEHEAEAVSEQIPYWDYASIRS